VRFRLLRPVALAAAVVGAGALVAPPAIAQTIPDLETRQAGDLQREVIVAAPDVADVTALEVTSDGRVILVERTGRVKIWHQDDSIVEAGRIGVDSRSGQCNDCPGLVLDEGGLHGLLLAEDFDETGHIYVYYSVPNSLGEPTVPPKMPGARGPDETEGKFRLSRFTLVDETLDMASEEILLENPAEWFHCCHYGGDMEWLPDGTLLLSVGDDTISSESNGGYSPRDYRPGKEYNNADLTSQNLADRRGKLLRIDVEDVDGDGSLIPADNPFLDNAEADPYVYAYGFRSNYRFAVDPATGNAFVGTVGPDAKNPNPLWGPAEHEEMEEVPYGGGTNHGWPRCIANNLPYNDYSFVGNAAVPGQPLSCEGMTPASIYYSYNPSPTSPFVQMGFGGTCDAIMGGVVYDRPETGALRLPERFDDHLMWLEWCRGVLVSTPINSDGKLDTAVTDVKVVLSGMSSPIDITTGPDGALYVAEYASRNYNGNNSLVSRIKCTGCTPDSADYGGVPVVEQNRRLASASAIAVPRGGRQVALVAGGLLVAAVLYGRARRRRVA
jgi:aldose sugar dehydrogenase